MYLFVFKYLAFWFSSQMFYVKWQNILSESFIPTCGLRQGSIISPLFFNFYLDEFMNTQVVILVLK